MNDLLLHIARNITIWDVILLMTGSCFIGIFGTLIVMIEKSKVNYIESEKKPWRMSLVIGFRGSNPVFEVMYSPEFVRHIYEKSKGYQARLAAMKKIGGQNEKE